MGGPGEGITKGSGEKTPHLVSFESVIKDFTSNVADVNKHPRAIRIDRTSLSEEGIRKVSSAHDAVGGLEYYLYPDKDGLIFGSGSRTGAAPFDPDDEETFIRSSFPLSLFRSPKKDPERERAEEVSSIAMAQGGIDAPWFAHWHPWGSGGEASTISVEDLLITTTLQGWHFMFNEHGVSMYSGAGRTKKDVLTIYKAERAFIKQYASEHGDNSLTSTEYLKAHKTFLIKNIKDQGFLYVEYPWGSHMASKIIKVMRGEVSLSS